jgi:drug/metabolite transporter (DMT)-like permease
VTPWRADIVILSCAISAGIHGALVREHFQDGAGPGAGFVVATLLLGAAMVALTLRPTSHVAPAAAAMLLVGLIVSYAFAVTTGLPLLHPDVEPVDGLALFTKAVEGAGLAAATSLLWRRPDGVLTPQPKGT